MKIMRPLIFVCCYSLLLCLQSALSAQPAAEPQAAGQSLLATMLAKGAYPIGKPCKEDLNSLSIAYRLDKSNPGMFETKQGNKFHPDIAEASFDCPKGRIESFMLTSKAYSGKNDVERTKQLIVRIIDSLHLQENGWKLIIAKDFHGSVSSRGTFYARAYQRDNVVITFSTQADRETPTMWAVVRVPGDTSFWSE